MRPTRGDILTSKVLTGYAVSYAAKQDTFLATRLFPMVGGPNSPDEGKIRKWTAADVLRDEAGIIAPGTPAPRVSANLSTTSYTVERYGAQDVIPDDLTGPNDDDPAGTKRGLVAQLTHKTLLRLERAWASAYFTTGQWGKDNTLTGNDRWDVYGATDSDPVTDLRKTAVEDIRASTGVRGNVLVLGAAVATALESHPAVLEGPLAVGQPVASREYMAKLFSVERVLVMDGVYNTAPVGDTASYSDIWGKSALRLQVSEEDGFPNAGVTVVTQPLQVRTWRDEEERATHIEVTIKAGFALLDKNLGSFWNTVVS